MTSTKRLTAALAALAVFQFLHGLAPAPESAPEEGGFTGFVGGIGFLVATVVAIVAVQRRAEWGRPLARLLGVAIPTLFVLYHGAWFTSPITNPYWGDGSATGWQWATLPPVMLAGLLTAVVASEGTTEPARREASSPVVA